MNNIWAQFDQAKVLKNVENKKDNNKKGNKKEKLDPRALVNNYEMIYGNANSSEYENIVMLHQAPKNEPFYHPEVIQTLQHVILLVKKVYHEIYPMKLNTYPKGTIDATLSVYNKIRELRAKDLAKKGSKGNNKNGMKGLKMPAVVAVILQCIFLNDNNPIPSPLIIYYVNKALSRGATSLKTYKLITMKNFEDYRLDAKKGLRSYIQRVSPRCYNNIIGPENYIHLSARLLYSLEEPMIKQAQKLAREVEQKRLFKETVPSGTIALACLLVTCVKNDIKVIKSKFGIPHIPETTLVKMYNTIVSEFKYDLNKTPFTKTTTKTKTSTKAKTMASVKK